MIGVIRMVRVMPNPNNDRGCYERPMVFYLPRSVVEKDQGGRMRYLVLFLGLLFDRDVTASEDDVLLVASLVLYDVRTLFEFALDVGEVGQLGVEEVHQDE